MSGMLSGKRDCVKRDNYHSPFPKGNSILALNSTVVWQSTALAEQAGLRAGLCPPPAVADSMSREIGFSVGHTALARAHMFLSYLF